VKHGKQKRYVCFLNESVLWGTIRSRENKK
jgi:hypothetical protein